jgi:signal transduction histidine kinase
MCRCTSRFVEYRRSWNCAGAGPVWGKTVRFDDKLTTVIAQPSSDSAALSSAWLQIVDILAQNRSDIAESERRKALARLDHWRSRVPAERRKLAAMSLSHHSVPFDVVALFATDTATVAAPVLSAAKLDDNGWAILIPKLPQSSRALLRERRDLPTHAKRMLASYGTSDFALPDVAAMGKLRDEGESVTQDDPVSEIRALVSRIEAFRRDRGPQDFKPIVSQAVTGFRFETSAAGVISWVDGAPRGPIVGIEIAAMAEVGEHGVDGQAAGAFKRRTPFRNARMIVPGAGSAAGQWLISGLPCFDETTGRFTGYRCSARRPELNEGAAAPIRSLLGPGLPADSIRQLVHELRTPLNAIRGFAEMISGQLLGPVSSGYRARAEEIINDSKRLLALFEDLDTAAKLDRGTVVGRGVPTCDLGVVFQTLADEFRSLTDARRVHLRLFAPQQLSQVAVDALTAERMVGRLMATVIGLASPGESIEARLTETSSDVCFAIARPKSLAGMPTEALLDPSYGPEGEWPDAPALGLGFALRLTGNMAKSAKARFEIEPDRFALIMPHAAVQGDASESL